MPSAAHRKRLTGDNAAFREGQREQRLGSQCPGPPCSGHNGCHRDRHEAARFPFEQQQLHGQQHRGDRSAERRAHSRGRPRDQECLTLGIGEMEELREQRTHRAPRHDDRPFRAERTAGADGHRGMAVLGILNFGLVLIVFGLMALENACNPHLVQTFMITGCVLAFAGALSVGIAGLTSVVARITNWRRIRALRQEREQLLAELAALEGMEQHAIRGTNRAHGTSL